MKKVLISHPYGNQNVSHAAVAFAEAGLLSEFWVGAAWDDMHWVNDLLPSKIRVQLERRSFPSILKPYIKQTFAYEAARMLMQIAGLSSFAKQYFSVVAAHERMDKNVSVRLKELSDVGLIYAYDHCALETFKVAEQNNIRRVLELPIPPWRGHIKILQEEMARHPTWCGGLTPLHHLATNGEHKDAELALAETVIVPSDFAKNSLVADGYRAEKIRVVPYGAPQIGQSMPRNNHIEPLKVLFVGGVGLLKGAPYLLSAINQLGRSVTLTLIGRVQGNNSNVLNDIKKHTWFPSLPHHEVLEQMRQHDVLVFPSLYEGFGLVILEALSQGLPVISTANTGATHIIEDGKNGFIVPIRSSEAIEEKLELLNCDRDLLNQLRQGALVKAAECSWGQYRNKLVNEIYSIPG